ncbi:cobalt-precorrin-6A reductase [Rhodopila globiformis]|uniref:Cobalt-precorrin-6A reductase n=1 Tax=Rhodopila globiformis TaxID=1071 RepID=A0A2S6NGL8_RHOGL|nr:cobalt-precorrin-6A reductase [Rhodopila globiformis]PPQ33740.1 cobalt-precorrin-6A reductase [Rhodopila globiformis]
MPQAEPGLLILGGTTEGYALAAALVGAAGLRVVSSLAGRTANPRLPAGACRIGGFGGPEGLAAYLRESRIAAVVDATHPFASQMGWNAAAACAATGTSLLRLERPAWQPGPGDHWHVVADWTEAAEIVGRIARHALLALGRQEIGAFAPLDHVRFLIRMVDPPDPMPRFAQAELLLARGPFTEDAEYALLRDRRIDTIVCKNSGGSATDGKLAAARRLGIPVVMRRRPARPDTPHAATVAEAVAWVRGALGSIAA